MKKLFTWDNCSNCEAAKKYIADNNITDIEIVHIDISERSGRDLKMKYRVMGVPTLITFDGETEIEIQVWIIDFSKI